ncbi:hypothetical protein [Aeromonas jandaei]|uniref:hypothetical protein n=1 Tax=Aeromonas jandaei TaxID=650 RepID=UPI002AA0DBFB|nr:hypothetical protein [Aeromonas jandaei]
MRRLLLLISLYVAGASAAPKLELPYYDWGRCPFEGCTYQTWLTKQEIIARASPSPAAKVLFKVPRGQQVQGLTGVVITEKTGRINILKPITLGYNDKNEGPLLPMHAGEQLEIIGWVGEGAGLFWYQGKTYTLDYDHTRTEIEYGSGPKTHWWVKIRDKKGHEGWVLESDNFAHMDRFE